MDHGAGEAAGLVVRVATEADLPLLPVIEDAADTLFAGLGLGPLPPASADRVTELARAEVVLVAGDPVVGFARVELFGGGPHLEQLSVHPSAGRRGVGSALVRACCAWASAAGHDQITLMTFRDVPFNAPFYARLGFVAVPDEKLPPALAALRRHEAEIGLDALGPRVAMRRALR